MIHGKKDSQQGFTIVELLIAITIFSLILTIITMGVMYFSKSYFKSVNVAATQSATRAIVDNISQSVQFGATPTGVGDESGSSYFCAGGNTYTFKKGAIFDGDTSTESPGLYVRKTGESCEPSVLNGKQLLGRNMRISDLDVSNVSGGLYNINVIVAYGDDDLFNCGDADCASQNYWSKDISCKPDIGNEYCAVSRLNTTVSKRIGSVGD